MSLLIIAAAVGGVGHWDWSDERGSSPPAAEAAPTIAWTPSSLSSEVGHGQTKTVSASFVSSQNLMNVVVHVVPELQPYVQVSPTSFASIVAAQTYVLNITFAAGSRSPVGTFDGTIQLRQRGTLAKPLPIQLVVTVIPLPPDPGDAGKATLAGIDSDSDGVRDDVHRYIALTVPESARHREALRAVALSTQDEILANTIEQSLEAAVAGIRSIECLSYLGVRKQGRWKEVEALMLNTEARVRAMDAHNERINGQVFSALPDNEKRSACKFDVEALPNCLRPARGTPTSVEGGLDARGLAERGFGTEARYHDEPRAAALILTPTLALLAMPLTAEAQPARRGTGAGACLVRVDAAETSGDR